MNFHFWFDYYSPGIPWFPPSLQCLISVLIASSHLAFLSPNDPSITDDDLDFFTVLKLFFPVLRICYKDSCLPTRCLSLGLAQRMPFFSSDVPKTVFPSCLVPSFSGPFESASRFRELLSSPPLRPEALLATRRFYHMPLGLSA